MKIQLCLVLVAILFAVQLPAQTTKNSNGLQPGDIHPDAKVIDADELYPFNKGLATKYFQVTNKCFNTNGKLLIEPSCVQGCQTHSK